MRQAESKLSLCIRRALNARGHLVWKNHGSIYSEAGLSDLSGVAIDARAIILETKMPGKETSGLSAVQMAFLKRCVLRAPLAIVAVVSSVEDAITAVEAAGYAAKVHESGLVSMVPLAELTYAEREVVLDARRRFGR